MREKIEALINSNFNANEVATAADIPTNTAYRIFSGEAKLDNISLRNAEKLAAYWDANKLRDYGYVHTLVKEAIANDDELYELASAWLNKNDGGEIIEILTEQYHQATCSVDDFEMPLRDYVAARIEFDSEEF